MDTKRTFLIKRKRWNAIRVTMRPHDKSSHAAPIMASTVKVAGIIVRPAASNLRLWRQLGRQELQ